MATSYKGITAFFGNKAAQSALLLSDITAANTSLLVHNNVTDLLTTLDELKAIKPFKQSDDGLKQEPIVKSMDFIAYIEKGNFTIEALEFHQNKKGIFARLMLQNILDLRQLKRTEYKSVNGKASAEVLKPIKELAASNAAAFIELFNATLELDKANKQADKEAAKTSAPTESAKDEAKDDSAPFDVTNKVVTLPVGYDVLTDKDGIAYALEIDGTAYAFEDIKHVMIATAFGAPTQSTTAKGKAKKAA
jgi:hypothetical protein